MNPKLEETIVLDFTTHSPTTGGVSDADSTPSVDVFEDTTDTAILTPTPVKRSGKTGNYRVSVACTAANGFEAGKSYNVVASATVGGVTGKGVVGSIQVRTRSTDDVLPTSSYTAPPSAASIRSEIDANSTKLDVTVGSRLSTAGYTAPNNAGISSILTAVDTEVAAILAAVDTEVAAIKAKTDALPADTNATLSALTALVDDIEGRLTAVRAGLLDNLSNLDAAITSRLAPTVSGRTLTVAATGEADANLSTTAIAAIWSYVVTGAITAVQLMRGFAAVLMGKSSGHESNAPKYRDLGDTKNVIDAATDANGNRTTVTRDLA